MTIWILNPFDELPGENAPPGRYWSLARVLVARGHRVTWWSADFSHRNKKVRTGIPESHEGFRIRLVPVRPYLRNVGLARVRSHLGFGRAWLRAAEAQEERPDLILASHPPVEGPLAALTWRGRHGATLVLDLQDAWPENFGPLLPVPRVVQPLAARLLFAPWFAGVRKACRGADALSAVGRGFLETALRRGATSPTHVCYLGAERAAAPAGALSPRSHSGELRLLYIGNMGRSQDLRCLLHALALVPKEVSLAVDFAGGGELESELRALAQSLKLGGRARFHGFLRGEPFTRLVQQAEVGLNPVLPSSGIVCPNKVCDYLCAGLPVVDGLGGELGELLREFRCGWSYPSGDAAALARVLAGIVEKRAELPAYSAQARVLSARWFDRSATYPKWAEWLEGIRSRGAGRG